MKTKLIFGFYNKFLVEKWKTITPPVGVPILCMINNNGHVSYGMKVWTGQCFIDHAPKGEIVGWQNFDIGNMERAE